MDLGSFPFQNTEEEESNEQSTRLSWRLDPELSFSDWTIEVEIIQDEETEGNNEQENMEAGANEEIDDKNAPQTVFHVHKTYLGIGDRRSLYFQRVFNSSRNPIQLQEGLESASKIKLEMSAVRAFPIMLDYIYSSLANGALSIDSESAVALRWLSSYFGIRPMFEATNDFIDENLSIENAHIYLREAAVFSDDKIVEAASTICSEKLDIVAIGDLVQLSPEHLSLVVQKARDVQSSEVLSQRVRAYCDAHRDRITLEMLAEWTHPNVMPVIASDAALSLICHADIHNADKTLDGSGGDGGGNSLVSLYERCRIATSHSWESTLLGSIQDREQAVKSGYCDISDKSKVSILEDALIDAGKKVRRARDVLSKLQRLPNHSYWTSNYYSQTSTACVLNLEGFDLTPKSVNGAALRVVGGDRTLALFFIPQ